MTELCVGATSRLVIEEAAKLGVAQVIASRRQVNADGGYTGVTQADLVAIVRKYSGGKTAVVRDHGGPYQNGNPHDNWVRELDEDVDNGFNALHLDVSKVAADTQVAELSALLDRYGSNGDVSIQIGGERDSQDHLFMLLAIALSVGTRPTHCIIALGGHADMDKQCGELLSSSEARRVTAAYHTADVKSVAHNMDFTDRHRYTTSVDAMNVAPEYGVIEMDAWLRVVPNDVMVHLLEAGHKSKRWVRWFNSAVNPGTDYERSRCGLRYIWASERKSLEGEPWFADAEDYVRKEISDAIVAG